MILREILVTRKLGVKHIVGNAVPEWYGGHPVFPVAPGNLKGTIIQRQPGFIGENYDYIAGDPNTGTAVGGILTSDPAGQITAAFSGEYDWKDFLYFSQPVVTTAGNVGDRAIGLAMHSSKIRPTEFGLPDSKEFVTVLFFPCTVTIALDAREVDMFVKEFDDNLVHKAIDITLNNNGPAYVKFEYDAKLNVFKITNADNASEAVGAVLAGDDATGVYTIEFWG
jgi:hypothetical protein